MARLATFIDAGYIEHLLRDEFNGVSVGYAALARCVQEKVQQGTSEPIDLLRTFYYNCPPYQADPPTDLERQRYAGFRQFQQALEKLPRFDVRLGRLQYKGQGADGKPIFAQKQVDLLLGLDLASLSAKNQIQHIALVAGDGDFVPACKYAKEEGVSVWLFHGPSANRLGRATYSQELWRAADNRVEIDAAFAQAIARPRP